jgi:hypothetical protein
MSVSSKTTIAVSRKTKQHLDDLRMDNSAELTYDDIVRMLALWANVQEFKIGTNVRISRPDDG